jgi:uncharacterized protein (TIGR03435 family)
MPYWRIPNAERYEKNHFDFSARMADGTTADQFRTMLRNLLSDRFKLETHREMREMNMFRLVIVKGGSKLQRHVSNPPASVETKRAGHYYNVDNKPIADFTKMLEPYVHGPIKDETGLAGTFDIRFSWWVDGVDYEAGKEPDDIDPNSTVFTALKLQLGLQLIPSKGKVEILVIDHAERPTEN